MIRRVIPPQAVSSSPALAVSALGTGPLAEAAKGAAGGSLFQTLFESTVSGFSANVSPLAPTESAIQGAPNLMSKGAASEDDQDQQNVADTPSIAPSQISNPILLASFCWTPLNDFAAGISVSKADADTQANDTKKTSGDGNVNAGTLTIPSGIPIANENLVAALSNQNVNTNSSSTVDWARGLRGVLSTRGKLSSNRTNGYASCIHACYSG